MMLVARAFPEPVITQLFCASSPKARPQGLTKGDILACVENPCGINYATLITVKTLDISMLSNLTMN